MSESVSWKSLRKDAMTTLEGDFPAAFTEATIGNAASSGKAMIKCVLKITEGTYAGRKIYHNFTFSPESQPAMQMFFRHLGGCGLDDAWFDAQPEDQSVPELLRSIADALLGRQVTVKIVPREWNGSMRENINAFSEYGASTGLPTASALPTAAALPTTAAPLPSTQPPADPF